MIRDMSVVRFRRQVYAMQAIVLAVLCVICLTVPLNTLYRQLYQDTLNQIQLLDTRAKSRYDRIVSNMDAMTQSQAWQDMVAQYLTSVSVGSRATTASQILRELNAFAENNRGAAHPILITPTAFFHDGTTFPYQAPEGIKNRMNTDIRLSTARKIYGDSLDIPTQGDASGRVILSPVGEDAYLAALVYNDTLYANDNDLRVLAQQADNQLGYVSPAAGDVEGPIREDILGFFGRKDFGRPALSIFAAHDYTLGGQHFWAVEAIEDGVRYLSLLDAGYTMGELRGGFVVTCLLAAAVFVVMLVPLRFACRWAFAPFDVLMTSIRGTEYAFTGAFKRLRNKRQLQVRFFICYCLVLVPTILLSPFLYGVYQPVLQKNVREMHTEIVAQQSEAVQDWVDHAVATAKRISTNAEIQRMMRLLNERDGGAAWDPQTLAALHNNGVLQSASYIRLYNRAGVLCFSTKAGDTVSQMPVTADAFSASGGTYPFYRFVMDANDNEQCSLFCAVRETSITPGYALFDTIGYIEFGLSSFPQSVMLSDSYSYLYDSSAWMLVGTSKHTPLRHMIEGLMQAENRSIVAPISSRAIQVDYDRLETAAASTTDRVFPPHMRGEHERFLVTFSRLTGIPWVFINVRSMQLIEDKVFEALGTVIQAAGVMMLVLLAMSLLFTYQMLKPLRKAEEYVLLAEAGDILPEEVLPNNEFSALAYAFAGALRQIQALNKDVMEREREKLTLINRKTEAEIVTLHSQLNSHLFSNVFASMQLLLQVGNLQMLGQMLAAAGSFLRNGLVSGQHDATLAQEIEHTQAYVTLQMLRHGDNLHVDLSHIPEALHQAIVPQYLLQPVIENAIIHGMPTDRVLHITISGMLRDGALCLEVVNDGLLIPPELLGRVNRRLDRGQSSAKHIGLINIQERVQLRHGSGYGLAIENDDTGHVRVSIRLPYLTD